MIRTFIVTSQDGAQFSVQVYSRTQEQANVAERQEIRYAARKTAAELSAHGDFHLVGAEPTAVAPALPRREVPSLKLIQGGLSAREYDTIDSLLADTEIVLI